MDVEADVRRLYRREVFQWALHGWTSSHRWAGTSGHPLQQLECYAALVIFAVCVCKSSQCRYWHSVALCSKDLRLICWSRWFLPEIIISSGFQHVQGSFLGFNPLTFWVGNAKKGHSDAKLLPCVSGGWLNPTHIELHQGWQSVSWNGALLTSRRRSHGIYAWFPINIWTSLPRCRTVTSSCRFCICRLILMFQL